MIVKINDCFIQLEDYTKIVKAKLKNPYILETEVYEILEVHFILMSETEKSQHV